MGHTVLYGIHMSARGTCLEWDPAFLQQVVDDGATDNGASLVEVDLRPLAEARRVIVAHCLGVSERLHDGVRLQNLYGTTHRHTFQYRRSAKLVTTTAQSLPSTAQSLPSAACSVCH